MAPIYQISLSTFLHIRACHTALHVRSGCEHGSMQPSPAPAVLGPPSGRGLFASTHPMKARAARKNNRGLYRVNQYRPRITNMTAAQLHAASIITKHLPNQPNLIKVHRTGPTVGSRGILRADANADRTDIDQVSVECGQVDDPLIPSGRLRCGWIIMIDHGTTIHPRSFVLRISGVRIHVCHFCVYLNLGAIQLWA